MVEVGGRQIEDRMHGVMDGPEILLAFISSADSPDTDTALAELMSYMIESFETPWRHARG